MGAGIRDAQWLRAVLLMVVEVALLCPALRSSASGQATGPVAPVTEGEAVAATRVRVTQQRDRVIARMQAEGFHCRLAPPVIVIEDVPSYGNYQNESNHLRTAEWTLLRPQERAFFSRIAGAGEDEAAVRAFFERAVHQWIFVHELGHWWQNCNKAIEGRPPYAVEYGANRFALAYWREADPGFAASMSTFFAGMLEHMPSPVPAGLAVEPYFNDNYEKLGPSPAYPWFQARMIVSVSEEKPAPSFAKVVAEMK